MYKIKLSDGTELVNLKVNGDFFITEQAITEDFFKGKLSSIEISGSPDSEDGERPPFFGTCKNLLLSGVYQTENGSEFAFRERTKRELIDERFQAQIDYLAMMNDTEM